MIVSIIKLKFNVYPTTHDIEEKIRILDNYYLNHTKKEYYIYKENDDYWYCKITCKQNIFKFIFTHIFLYPFMFFNILQFEDMSFALRYIYNNMKKIYKINKKNIDKS